MGLFDKKIIVKEEIIQSGTQKLYRIQVSTNSETYNIHKDKPLDICEEEVKKIINNQYLKDGLLFIPLFQIKKLEIIEVK